MNCRNCGTPLKPDDRFCTNCGLPVTSADFEGATVAAPAPGSGYGAPTAYGEPAGYAAPARAPVAKLVALTGDNIGQETVLEKPENIVGRMPDCDVVIDDARVSRRHAAIRYAATQFVVQDLGSANGTLVNDDMITEPTELHDGDIINLGVVSFLFRIEEPVEEEYPIAPAMAPAVPVESVGGLRDRLAASEAAPTQFAPPDLEAAPPPPPAEAAEEALPTQFAPPAFEAAPPPVPLSALEAAEPEAAPEPEPEPSQDMSDTRLASLLSVEPEEAEAPPADWRDLLSAPAEAVAPPPAPPAAAGPASSRTYSEQEDAEVAEAFNSLDQTLGLLRESFDSSRQTVDSLQGALADLRRQMVDARADASGAHAEAQRLGAEVESLEAAQVQQRSQLAGPLQQLREVGTTSKDYRSLTRVLEDLASAPRDIDLLTALGRQRDSILELVRFQENAKQRVTDAITSLESLATS